MKIGFIGVGSMSQAIIKGVLNKDFIAADDIHCYNRTYSKLEKLVEEVQIVAHHTIDEVIENVDVLVLGVKPQNFELILSEYNQKIIEKNCVVVSIAAGISIADLERQISNETSIIRVMPTVAALVGESVSSITPNKKATKEEVDYVLALFDSIGHTYQIDEKDITAFTGITGCSVAFTLMYLNALGSAGLKNGLAKDVAIKAATQSVIGSAQLALNSDQHVGSLIDSVTSPGGTTIAGVAKLHENAFTSAVIQAVDATIARANEISDDK